MGVSSWDSCWKRLIPVVKDAKVHPHLGLCLSPEDGDNAEVVVLSFVMASWGSPKDSQGERGR